MDVRREVVDLVSGFALFAELKTPELEKIVDSCEEVSFATNERVLREGLSGNGFYVILEGAATIRVGGQDYGTLRSGDYFGEISCLLGEPPVADIVAQGHLRCLVLPCEEVEAFLVANPRVMFRLLQGEARKVRKTTLWR